MSTIEIFLKSCRELARFCSHNGWIDSESLQYSIVWENDKEVLVNIEFDELLMEGAGRIADKVTCYGQMRLFLDRHGQVVRAEIL